MKATGLLREALRTKRNCGIGLLRQAFEATRLRWGANRLDPWEYFFFAVYSDRYPPAEKRRFIGWRREIELDRLLNIGPSREIANDKLAFFQFMRARGTPLACIEATYLPHGDAPEGVRCLRDPGAVARWLTDTAEYPLFVKPIRGAHGWRARVLKTRGDAASFVANLERDARRGYLFQQLLRTHATVAAACGDRLTTVRLVVFVAEDESRLLSAVWRIPTGANETDNFSVGISGNLIAAVDIATGTTGNVVQGVGWETRPVERHPDTGGMLAGLRLPDWPATLDLCLDSAGLFPELRLQHWDIALTDRGPVVLELNVEGGLRTHQIVAPGPAKLWRLEDVRG